MNSNYLFAFLFCLSSFVCNAQDNFTNAFDIGDTAPPLKIKDWVKGAPVSQFEKGKVYVIEFWASWCIPCKAAMPHLSKLAEQYKDSVTVIGVDIYESKNITSQKIKHFVDSMDWRMNYTVAIQDSNFMETDWFDAADVKGIPNTFVINGEGKLAWIGHPKDLNKVLPQIVNNTWNIIEALDKRKTAKYLHDLDISSRDDLIDYKADFRIKPGRAARPNEMLIAINKIIREEPKLKYAYFVGWNTFDALLKTNQQKALEYGKLLLVNKSYGDETGYDVVIEVIETNSNKLKIIPEIYQLGIEACYQEINSVAYPEIVNMGKRYHRMAVWYWQTKNISEAINAEKKAIEYLKNDEGFSKTKLAEYEASLKKYQSKGKL